MAFHQNTRTHTLLPFTRFLLLGYCIGSFPTAFLLVKWKRSVDIRGAGTGNVGAMNAFDVTGSKVLGLAVLLIDLFKGVLAVWLAMLIGSDGFWNAGLAGIGAILGHNYSPWLKFKGGRGLATAAGVAIMIAWILVAFWTILWFLLYRVTKNLHHANIFASIGTPLIWFLVPPHYLSVWTNNEFTRANIGMLSVVVFSLIILRHTDVLIHSSRSSQP